MSMLEAVLNVVKELDLNDQEKEYATDYFRGITERKPSLFKKEMEQKEGKETTSLLPVN